MKNSKFLNRDKILAGLELTYQRLIEFKKQKGTPLILYKDGKVVEVNPNEALPTVK